MKTKIVLLSFLIVCNTYLVFTQCSGSERWEEKILEDSKRDQINMTATNEYKTVQDIRNIPFHSVGDNDERMDIEFKTVQINCKIKKFKFVGGKKGDNDYHIVLYPVGHPEITMVSEILDPTCPSVKNAKYVKKFKKARDFIDNHSTMRIGSSAWWEMEDVTYIVYGVLYRDQKHGVQPDQAPNFIEIHPILKLKVKK
jgi:hypothetical protein